MIKTKTPPRLAEVGKIKIGMKGEIRNKGKANEFRIPLRLDHFLITTTDKDNDGNFIVDKAVMDKLDASPTELSIRLLFDDIDMNFFTSYQFYKGRKCVCRGDGETADWMPPEGEHKKIPCDFEQCQYAKANKCKVSGILSCMLPDSDYVGGVYRFRTHGWNSVSGILAALDFFQRNTNGILQGLPLKLKFLKKHTEEHGSVPTVTIVLDKIELLQMRELAMAEAENRERLGVDIKLIEKTAVDSGLMDDNDDPADVAAEFYTEEIINNPEKGTGADDLAGTLTDRKEAATPPEKDTGKKATKKDPAKTKKTESVI